MCMQIDFTMDSDWFWFWFVLLVLVVVRALVALSLVVSAARSHYDKAFFSIGPMRLLSWTKFHS
jgi:hypothetical protein